MVLNKFDDDDDVDDIDDAVNPVAVLGVIVLPVPTHEVPDILFTLGDVGE